MKHDNWIGCGFIWPLESQGGGHCDIWKRLSCSTWGKKGDVREKGSHGIGRRVDNENRDFPRAMEKVKSMRRQGQVKVL